MTDPEEKTREDIRTALAKSILKHSVFGHMEEVSTEAIWQAQLRGVQENWKTQADAVIADLENAGYEISQKTSP